MNFFRVAFLAVSFALCAQDAEVATTETEVTADVATADIQKDPECNQGEHHQSE